MFGCVSVMECDGLSVVRLMIFVWVLLILFVCLMFVIMLNGCVIVNEVCSIVLLMLLIM